MSIINNLDRDKQYERNEFVVELINENINLMDENIKLVYENKKLKKQVMELQLDIKKLELLNITEEIAPFVKVEEGYVVMIMKSGRKNYNM